MISERTRRSVYIETILAPEEVRAAFGQCGEMYVQPVILYDRLLMSPHMRDSRGVYAAGVTEDSLHTRYVHAALTEPLSYFRATTMIWPDGVFKNPRVPFYFPPRIQPSTYIPPSLR